MNRNRGLLSLILAALLLAAAVPELSAGKPAPPPNPHPPPPPQFTYEDRRADLGGWLDIKRNLIWGMPISELVGGATSYDRAVEDAADYANVLNESSLWHEQESLRYQGLSVQYASDPVRYPKYVNLALAYGIAADDLTASAQVASQFNNWRMPTKDEASDAIRKGYFTYTDDFAAWDTSPLPGLQQRSSDPLYWTTTADKGARYQWAFYPGAGTFQSVLKDRSYLFSVAVRTHVP